MLNIQHVGYDQVEWSPDEKWLAVSTSLGNYLVDPTGQTPNVKIPQWGDWQRLAP
jgi:hypothetical protein